ncbi:MAG: AAA family ATPase [Eisenbergiella massiliensis]|uniref:AAA family ATPase n=1 Tax=Eisenbergiella massiliensis TaxID=1720294 RepID=UPI00399138B6
MRIIIDGTVGAGKTTLITGNSQRDTEHKQYLGLSELGFPVYTDLITNVIKELRERGISDPSLDWRLFFNVAVEHCISNYNNASNNTINFYDRGIFFLELLAKRYDQQLPQLYFDFCKDHFYDNPVFIFEPILSIDMTRPHETDNKQKSYTVEDRIRQHHDVIDLYKKWGYNVIEVPLGSNKSNESNIYRLNFIKKILNF